MPERETKRKCFWILARDPDSGKPFLIFGSDKTEEDARQKAFEMLGGVDFEIHGLYTRNMAKASSIIRGKRLEDTHSLHKASERLGHDRSLRKMMRRRRFGD